MTVYDRQGNEIDIHKWITLQRDPGYSTVGYYSNTLVNISISTVYIGTEYALYETLIALEEESYFFNHQSEHEAEEFYLNATEYAGSGRIMELIERPDAEWPQDMKATEKEDLPDEDF